MRVGLPSLSPHQRGPTSRLIGCTISLGTSLVDSMHHPWSYKSRDLGSMPAQVLDKGAAIYLSDKNNYVLPCAYWSFDFVMPTERCDLHPPQWLSLPGWTSPKATSRRQSP